MSRGRGRKQLSRPQQKHLDIKPDYIVESGVKFEFTGTLLVPAPGEAERLAAMPKPAPPLEAKQIITAAPGVLKLGGSDCPTRNGVVTHFAVRRVKIEPREMLRLAATKR